MTSGSADLSHRIVDAAGIALVAVWLVASLAFWAQGNGEMVQRFGAFGVFVVATYFALENALGTATNARGDLERTTLTRETIDSVYALLMMTRMEIAALASRIRQDRDHDGRPADPDIEAILSRSLTRHAPATEWLDRTEERERHAERELQQELEREARLALRARRRAITQAVLLALGTLQWGFGDLLVRGAPDAL